ncbi:MAG: copper chaperone PCu(A)C, partial [Halofilum sp. (in: g-proteobacteria)]
LPALAGELRISDARTPPPLPGTSMMAGYLTLTNKGDRPVTVTGATSATSADFARVSVHRSIEEDGQSRMEPVPELTVDPGEQAAFEPGGLHLMLFEPADKPEPGDAMNVTLQTDTGTLDVVLQVIDRSELLR